MARSSEYAAQRPRIAVTTSRRSGWRVFPLMALGVRLGGGRAVRWRAGAPADLAAVDGLVIGGGDDISPYVYGGQLVASARLDPARDAMERRLAEEAVARDVPVLGVCRGSQMLNVALGGSLDQNAYATYRESRKMWTVLPKKTIEVTPQSDLGRIVGLDPMRVNSLHSQAVDRLGEGLRVAARDRAGMIQAVERAGAAFAIGVQWHPELLFYARRQRALFAALVAAARLRRRVV